MQGEYLNFGDFIARKRVQRKITVREMARRLKISSPYLNEIEKDKKNSFDIKRLELISNILEFSEEEKIMMMDLAGQKRHEIAPDIHDYIMDNYYVTAAIRMARDLGAAEEEWLEMVETLKRR